MVNDKNSNGSKRDSLVRVLISKLRSDKSKQLIMNYIIPISFFLLISVFIFRNLIGVEGEIINGDLVRPSDLDKFYNYFTPMWREDESVTVISRLPGLLFYLPFFGIGHLFDLNTAEVLIIVFIFVEMLTGLSMYYASKYILTKTYKTVNYKIRISAYSAGFAYMWSSFLIFHTLHPLIRVAYALAPLIIMFLIMGLETKKIRYIVLTAFLWCMACADVHWIVYGALLLFSFIVFNFILNYFRSTKDGKLKALKNSTIFHLKYVSVLIISFIGFCSYWFIPGLIMGGTSRYGYMISIENIERFYSQANVVRIIQKQGEHPLSELLFASNLDFINSPITQNLLILFGFGFFAFGIIALLLKPKNKYIVYFSCLTTFSIFLATLPNAAPELGYWLIKDAPLSELYGWSLRAPKIAQFIILGLCFLIGFTIVEILNRIERNKLLKMNFKRGSAVCVICILCLSIILPNWPLATGDVNGYLAPTAIPDEFNDVNSWLADQEGYFKVLWIPRYESREVDWNEDNRMYLDYASLTSSKPTYVFNNAHMQPNRYGIYFMNSIIDNDSPSLLLNNVTKNLGKILAPLHIRYIIFHNDNSVKLESMLLKNLFAQEDLSLVQKFGFIYIFENKYYDDQKSSQFFITSKDLLVSGGVASLATLNSIPNFESIDDGIIFGNQHKYDIDDLNEIVDDIILTKSSGLEDIAFSFADDKYFIAPSDYTDHFLPYKMWSRTKMSTKPWTRVGDRGTLDAWNWEYDKGVVFTWSTGTTKEGYTVSDQELLKDFDFENGLDNFTTLTSDLEIYRSKYSVEGDLSLKGAIVQGDTQQVQIAGSGLIPVPSGDKYYRVSLYIAGENIKNVQVKVRYFDENEKFISRYFLLTESGSFEFNKFERDILFPRDAKYCSIQVLADQNPMIDSYWWIDDLKIHGLENIIQRPKLEMDFEVDRTDEYDLFMRYLKSRNSGKFNLYLDGELIETVDANNRLNAFDWEQYPATRMSKGEHTITIENIVGFNVINLFALLPTAQTQDYFEVAAELFKNKGLFYTLEVENNFELENATISLKYGNKASFGKVVSFKDNGTAELPIQIFRDGKYTLSIRLIKERDSDNLNISIANNSYNLKYSGKDGFYWLSINNITLDLGVHALKIITTPLDKFQFNYTFEEGWNAAHDAPRNWFAPNPEYSVYLDPNDKTEGRYSLKLVTNSTNPHIWSQMKSKVFKIDPAAKYMTDFDLKIENVNSCNIDMWGYNVTTNKWVVLRHLVKGLRGTKDWGNYNKTFFVPANISRYYLVINTGSVLNRQIEDASTWFDNFHLERIIEEHDNEIDLVVLYLNEDNQTLKSIFQPAPTAKILDYEKLDATRYKLKISATQPCMLGFAETYDEFWVAHGSNLGRIQSMPIYGMLNGFFINKAGNFTLIIEYEPQQWFNLGASITGLSIAGCIGYLIWIDRKTWGERLKKLIRRNEKIVKK